MASIRNSKISRRLLALVVIGAAIGGGTWTGRSHASIDYGGYEQYNLNHSNGWCIKVINSKCYTWRSESGATSFIDWGPYDSHRYGFYYSCWWLHNASSDGQPSKVWIQTTYNTGQAYAGGAVLLIGVYPIYWYCYWAGFSQDRFRVEYRAVMVNPRQASEIDIASVGWKRYY